MSSTNPSIGGEGCAGKLGDLPSDESSCITSGEGECCAGVSEYDGSLKGVTARPLPLSTRGGLRRGGSVDMGFSINPSPSELRVDLRAGKGTAVEVDP